MKSIDIRTAQNVVIEYELASLRERFFAFFIDLIIFICFYSLILIFLRSFVEKTIANSTIVERIVFWLLPMGGFVLYQFMAEILANGQSFGKRVLGIKVVRLDGREPGLSEYTLRAVFHIVDTFFSAGVIGALLISSSLKNQRLGDLASNTTVVRIKNLTNFDLEDILAIDTLDNYQPQFPQVEQLSEEDMLLIKETLNRFRIYGNGAHHEAITELVVKVKDILGIRKDTPDPVEFLKTLLQDYIVLTR